MEKPIGYFIFAIQVIATLSIAFVLLVLPWFGGALDIMDYRFPGLSETCIILPITVVMAAIHPKLKNQTMANLFLILELILSIVLATQLLRLFGKLLSRFL
jgi:hypothetical protein